jgi:hypothetical protein
VRERLASKRPATRKAALKEFDEISNELERRVKAAKPTPDAATSKPDGEPGVGGKKTKADTAEMKDGKFTSQASEDAYKKYVERKTKENIRAAAKGKPVKHIRDRADWRKASDWWKNNSPIARGNDYNAKVRGDQVYDFHEVVLANGKRVDSYHPPANDKPGQIVSRKATDLNLIDQKSFCEYLDEMHSKYKPGTEINSPKYGESFKPGEKLKGDLILEVPDNEANRQAAKYRGFEDLAKSKKIEIRFREE